VEYVKTCKVCNNEKVAAGNFQPLARAKDGYIGSCYACRGLERKAHIPDHSQESNRERQRRWKAKHPELAKLYRKKSNEMRKAKRAEERAERLRLKALAKAEKEKQDKKAKQTALLNKRMRKGKQNGRIENVVS
jgi:hypothetical protein